MIIMMMMITRIRGGIGKKEVKKNEIVEVKRKTKRKKEGKKMPKKKKGEGEERKKKIDKM